MTFDYYVIFSSLKRHPNSYLVAQKFSVLVIFFDKNGHLRKNVMPSHRRFECCIRPKTACLLWLLKTYIGYKTSFAHNVSLCNSVTFKFWATLVFSRRNGNRQPKRFAFVSNTSQLVGCQIHWLKLFCLLQEIGIESSAAFLKCFSILSFCMPTFLLFWTYPRWPFTPFPDRV